MKYIRSCENCYKEIRFPIDKGTLFVTCPHCNYTSKINPDDPNLYKFGRFDITKPSIRYPEEVFFNSDKYNRDRGSYPDQKKALLKRLIVILLFGLLFSHVYKMFHSETMIHQEDSIEYPPNHPMPKEEKPSPEYEI